MKLTDLQKIAYLLTDRQLRRLLAEASSGDSEPVND